MAVVSYPGVYVEEVSSGVRPIAAASTSTAAFVGVAARGPINTAQRVTSWTEFQRIYGSFIPGSYLAHSVFAFFNNGGQQCYIVRVASRPVPAQMTLNNRAAHPGLDFKAASPGEWGNSVYFRVENASDDPDDNEFKLSIYRSDRTLTTKAELDKLAPAEVHDHLSMNSRASNHVKKVLSRAPGLVTVELNSANVDLVPGKHVGAKVEGTVTVDAEACCLEISVDHDGFQMVELNVDGTSLTDLSAIAASIQTAVRNLSPHLKGITPRQAFDGFICQFDSASQQLTLTSGTQTENSAVHVRDAVEKSVAAVLKLGSKNGGKSFEASAIRRPCTLDFARLGSTAGQNGNAVAPVAGSDGALPLEIADYQAGLKCLDSKSDFSLLAIPGVGSEVVLNSGLEYCANRPLQDVFYIGEMGTDVQTPEQAKEFRKDKVTSPNSYGAIYYPWVKAPDPTGNSPEPILWPPSGFIAGLYARTDYKRGVWKAPAGTEATLSGVVGLARDLTDVQQGILNQDKININCIRRFPAAGIVSWGARTITSDAEWSYVPVRRMAIMLRVSLYNGLQWAVFEPNDEELWSQIRLNVTSFMMTLFRRGAFQGATPSQAFFVKCDSDTTTQDDINLGIVNLLVGFAPLKPAEFVVVQISQKAGQTS